MTFSINSKLLAQRRHRVGRGSRRGRRLCLSRTEARGRARRRRRPRRIARWPDRRARQERRHRSLRRQCRRGSVRQAGGLILPARRHPPRHQRRSGEERDLLGLAHAADRRQRIVGRSNRLPHDAARDERRAERDFKRRFGRGLGNSGSGNRPAARPAPLPVRAPVRPTPVRPARVCEGSFNRRVDAIVVERIRRAHLHRDHVEYRLVMGVGRGLVDDFDPALPSGFRHSRLPLLQAASASAQFGFGSE